MFYGPVKTMESSEIYWRLRRWSVVMQAGMLSKPRTPCMKYTCVVVEKAIYELLHMFWGLRLSMYETVLYAVVQKWSGYVARR
jgi:hypothetical protein